MIDLILALIIAFFAGLIDAIAGGGGLIQIPGLLWLYPNVAVATLLGTNKLASFCGTAVASWHFVRHLKIKLTKMWPIMLGSFVFSMLGAKLATEIDNELLKPLVFGLLIIVGVYAYFNKGMGLISKDKYYSPSKTGFFAVIISSSLGFYDGFLGPGTGSFLIFSFIGWLGFDFLKSSAYAKLCNLASNAAAIILFAVTGHIIWHLALAMAVFNVLGNLVGAKLAIKKGSKFIRLVFLIVVALILMQLGYHFFFK